mgnify:CR=1 FL=1
MELRHLKATTCSECGTGIMSESIEREYQRRRPKTHSNGEQWEHRTFFCGKEIQWIPNYSRQECYLPCSRTPEAEHKKALREAAILHLTEQIEKLELDNEFRERLKLYLPSTRW